MSYRIFIKSFIHLLTIIVIFLIAIIFLFDRNRTSEISIRLMSYNIRLDTPYDGDNAWPYRKNMVTNLMEDYRIDFIGLQEVLPNQMNDILAKLTSYNAIFRTREINPEHGEGSPILYEKNKWTLLSSGTFWLSDTPSEPGTNTWGGSPKPNNYMGQV